MPLFFRAVYASQNLVNTSSSNVLSHSVKDLCGKPPRTQENWDWTPK